VEQYERGFRKNKYFQGEWTPTYICSLEALKAIKYYNKDVKILYLHRDPLARIWSEYNSFRSKGFYTTITDYTFKGLVDRSYHTATTKNLGKSVQNFLLYNSMYAAHLDNVYSLFPESNIKVISHSDVVTALEPTTHEIQRFIGVSPTNNKTIRPRHINPTKIVYDKAKYYEIEEQLKEVLYKDNARLREVYGIDYTL